MHGGTPAYIAFQKERFFHILIIGGNHDRKKGEDNEFVLYSQYEKSSY